MNFFKRIFTVSLMTTVLGCLNLHASNCCVPSPHHIFVGGEWQWVKEDGSIFSPSGNQWGCVVNYDYIQDCNLYLGADFSWAKGDLDDAAEYDVSDVDAQARIGWTCFINQCGQCFSVSPFVGFGYRRIDEDVTFETDFTLHYDRYYFPFGFHSTWYLSSCFDLGFNFQARAAVDTFGELNDSNILFVRENKWGFLVELPLTYHITPECCKGFDIRLNPFWKYEKYGSAKAIDLDTSFNYKEWGLQFLVGYRF